MNGVTFGTYHSYDDLGFYMKRYKIGEAKVQEHFTTIPGRIQGDLDLTEVYGYITYSNRDIDIDLLTLSDYETQLTEYSNLQNKIHGKLMHIIFDDDSDFYYVGRISVSGLSHNGIAGNVSVSINCEPYKYKSTVTTATKSYTTSYSTINLTNLSMPVVPTFNATVASVVKVDNTEYNLSAGERVIPDLVLQEGTTQVKIKGASESGSVTITYQEGEL